MQKAYDMRAKYRSVAGQRDYETYLATRPPDLTITRDTEPAANAGGGGGGATPPNVVTSPPLTSPPFTSPPLPSPPFSSPPLTSPPPPPVPQPGPVTVESLRADLRYLLGQFYLYYALLPYREGFRDFITYRTRYQTFIALGILGFTLGVAALGSYFNFRTPTLLLVVLSGVIGGYVSLLQRIQSAPAEGDALFNLASLTYGWIGMSLSPLYGAVFAMLLFLLFVSNIVSGAVFPTITTPDKFVTATATPTASPSPSPSPSPATTPAQTPASGGAAATPVSTPTSAASPLQTASPAASPAATPAATQTPTASPATTQTPTASPVTTQTPPPATPSPTPTPSASVFWRFTNETYPESGKAYALLLIWAFLAGFLERLVPDALNRLVLKNQIIEGTTT
ncbi:MAG: hypothetical protein LC795_05905 [Acidobacteria bacterium]|nr:hypothetical protein [Acidobacteriota bacterium]